MFPEHENLDQQAPPAEESPEQPRKKRNCGRTGPTTEAGKFNSSQNARKHGACARTLILPVESEQGWLILLSRFTDQYQPNEESLAYDFVLRTAQAEWFRLRTHRQYDEFLISTAGLPPFMWTPEQIKMHDLMLRYRNSAERSFHRELHALETYYKTYKLRPTLPPPPPPAEEEQPQPGETRPPTPPAFTLGSNEEIQQDILSTRTPISPDKEPPPSSSSS